MRFLAFLSLLIVSQGWLFGEVFVGCMNLKLVVTSPLCSFQSRTHEEVSRIVKLKATMQCKLKRQYIGSNIPHEQLPNLLSESQRLSCPM